MKAGWWHLPCTDRQKQIGSVKCRLNNDQYSHQHRNFAGPSRLPALFAVYVFARAEPTAIFPRLAAGLGSIHAAFSAGRLVYSFRDALADFVHVIVATRRDRAGDPDLDTSDATLNHFREAGGF